MIEVVPAKPYHIGAIAHRMREIDQLECRIMGHSPKAALRTGLMASVIAWTAKVDGRPEAMFGVTPASMIEGRGTPWMLMTDLAGEKHATIWRFSKIYLAAMHRHFTILENWVHADNDRTIRWLSRLGFAVGQVDVIRGHPMRPFVRHRE